MDWLGETLALPDFYRSTSAIGGGGIIQGSASEAVVVAIIGAKSRKQALLQVDNAEYAAKVKDAGLEVVYISDQTHSSVQKACMILGVKYLRIIPTNDDCSMNVAKLQEQIELDLSAGLVPCFVTGTVGTTSTCAVDDIDALGDVCEKYKLWLHVDSAYAGSSLICPENRQELIPNGLVKTHSFNFNPHKWLLTNFDCSAFWVKERKYLLDALSITPAYLRNKASESGLVTDYRDWQIPLGRRFRSLKLWFVMRTYGVIGLQNYIRHVSNFNWIHKKYLQQQFVCFKIISMLPWQRIWKQN